MSQGPFETEIKLPVRKRRLLLARIRRLGFRVKHERTFEANTMLDTSDLSLRRNGTLLRLREFGDRRVVTYKGPANASTRHKSREEVETTVTDLDQLRNIFEKLGYTPVFRYEKFRTEWHDGEGNVTLDETPIGEYLELEGPGEWIDRRAEELGYSEQDYITKSYGRLYQEHQDLFPASPKDMVFP